MSVSPMIRELLATRVDTFEKLDMLIALAGAPHHSLGLDALAERMGCQRSMVRQTIGELRKVMLVDLTSNGDARLMTLTETDRRTIEELVELHQADRSLVVAILAEQSLVRIRGLAARAFSDAFVLTRSKPKKGDGDG